MSSAEDCDYDPRAYGWLFDEEEDFEDRLDRLERLVSIMCDHLDSSKQIKNAEFKKLANSLKRQLQKMDY